MRTVAPAAIAFMLFGAVAVSAQPGLKTQRASPYAPESICSTNIVQMANHKISSHSKANERHHKTLHRRKRDSLLHGS